MRIALSAVGTRGDIQPMMALGLALRARGHDVRLCAPPNFEDHVIDCGLPFFTLGQDMREAVTEVCPDLVRNPLAPLRVMDDMVRLQFEDLRKGAEGAEVLVGAGIQLAGPSIAEQLGIPYFYAAYCPVILRSREHPAPLLVRQDRSGWVNLASWWLCEKFFDVMLRRKVNRERKKIGLDDVRSVYDYVFGQGTTLLATDRLLAPPPSDARSNLVTTGYWFWNDPAGLEPLDAELEAFLDDGPAPIFIGFGSMPSEDPARMTRQLVEVIQASGQRAVLQRGWAGLGDDELPPQIHAVGAVSHEKLFPRVSAVVHHGGAGTTASALRAGVPQVVVPHLVDQFYWAERVHRLGVGPRGPIMKRFDAGALAGAIRIAAQSAGLRDRANELKALIDQDGGLERAIGAIETLADA